MAFARHILSLALALALSACNQTATDGATSSSMASDVPEEALMVPADPGETAFCDVAGRRMRLEDCADLTSAMEQARQGTAAFNVPEELMRDETVNIRLSIGFPAETRADELEENMALRPRTPQEELAGQPGTIETYTPIVGRIMRAELTGDGFRIEPMNPAEQTVSGRSATTWEWAVTPLRHGAQELALRTVVMGVTADGTRYALLPTMHIEQVRIERTAWQATMDTFRDLPEVFKVLTAVLTGATALLAAFWAFRKALRKPRDDPGKKS